MYNLHRQAPGHLVMTRLGTFSALAEALAEAERIHDPALKGVTISVEQVGEPKPLASLSTRPIMGLFTMQQWAGRENDNAIFVAHETFDATDHVTLLPYKELLALQDNDESTDCVGLAYIEWDGPYEVEIVDSICEYFGVSKLADITESHHAYVMKMRQVFREAARVHAAPETAAAPAGAADTANNVKGVDKVSQFLAAIARMTLPSELDDPSGNGADPDDAQLALNRLILQSRELMADIECVDDEDASPAPR